MTPLSPPLPLFVAPSSLLLPGLLSLTLSPSVLSLFSVSVPLPRPLCFCAVLSLGLSAQPASKDGPACTLLPRPVVCLLWELNNFGKKGPQPFRITVLLGEGNECGDLDVK